MSRAVFYGTYNGILGDIYPVGEELHFRFFTVIRLVNGKIAEERELYDIKQDTVVGTISRYR